MTEGTYLFIKVPLSVNINFNPFGFISCGREAIPDM